MSATPADEIRAAEERVRMGDPRIDIAIRGPLAEWLDLEAAYWEAVCIGQPMSDRDHAALAVARAIGGEQR